MVKGEKNNVIIKTKAPNRMVVLGVFGFLLMFFSCKKDEVDLPTLLINPSDLVTSVEPGDTINFSINLEAEGGLARFEITQSINGGSVDAIFDTSFSGITLTDVTYSYVMPNSRVSNDITLVFKVYDEMNNIGSGARNLIITGIDSLLPETKGLSLYTYKSGGRNGFFINDDSLVYSDSVFFDDLDLVSTDTTDTLSLTLLSPIGNEFVAFNSFNYDSATFRTMSEAYEYGNPIKKLTNVQIGDVYITKLSTPTLYEYALIRFTNVVDDTGSGNDRYVFSIKK